MRLSPSPDLDLVLDPLEYEIHQFQISRKTEHKQLRLLIMFPEEYPQKCLMIEVKSKSLPERVMKLIESITEKEAKKLQGQYQVSCHWLEFI